MFLRIISVVFAGLTVAHADLVVVKKVKNAGFESETVIKVKGDRIRIEAENPVRGKYILLLDLKTQDSMTLYPAQKLAVKSSAAQSVANAEAHRKAISTNPPKLVFKATGEKEKVAGHECQIYTFEVGSSYIGKLWIAKDFPNYTTVRDEYAKVRKAAGTKLGFDPDKFDIDGIIVQAQTVPPTSALTDTLVSAEEKPILDFEFEIPADYKQVDAPWAK